MKITPPSSGEQSPNTSSKESDLDFLGVLGSVQTLTSLLKGINSIALAHRDLQPFLTDHMKNMSDCGEMLIDNLRDENMRFYSVLRTERKPFLAMNINALSKNERERRIKQVQEVSVGKERIGPGCSVLVDVLGDYLHASFFDYLAKERNGHLNQQMNTTLGNGRTKLQTRRQLALCYFANVQSILGLVYQYSNIGSSWCAPFVSESKFVPDVREIQHQCITVNGQLRVMADLVEFKRNSAGKNFITGVELLFDLVSEQLPRLYEPVEPIPNTDQHYQRLFLRSQMLKKLIDNVNFFVEPVDKFLKEKNYKKSLNDDMKAHSAMCDKVLKKLETVSKTQRPDMNQLRSLYQAIFTTLKGYQAPSLKIRMMTEIQSLRASGEFSLENENHVSLSFMFNLVVAFDWMQASLLREGFTVIYKDLLSISKPSFLQVDDTLTQLIDVTRTIKNTSSQAIEQTLLSLEADINKLTPGDTDLFLSMKKLWSDQLMTCFRQIVSPLHDLLEDRKKIYQADSDNIWNSTLALRDGVCIAVSQLQNGFSLCRKSLSILHGLIDFIDNADLRQLCEEIYDLNEMHLEAINVAITGIENLVGECFIDFNLQCIEEKKVEKQQKLLRDQIAKQAIAELLADEDRKHKKNNKKPKPKNKKKRSEPSVAKVEEKALLQKPLKEKIKPVVVAPRPKPVAVIIKPKPVFVVAKPVKKALVSPIPDSLKRICELVDHLKIKGVNEYDHDFRIEWRNAQLANLRGFVERVRHSKLKDFHAGTIFDQLDLARRMIEASLEVTMTHFPLIKGQESILRDDIAVGHQLHLLVKKLLSGPCARKSPESVRALIWELREVPYQLSQANHCVNYLYRTAQKLDYLPTQAQDLVHFLLQVAEFDQNQEQSMMSADTLLEYHNTQMQNAMYFVCRLLDVSLNPEKNQAIAILPSNQDIAEQLAVEVDPILKFVELQKLPLVVKQKKTAQDHDVPTIATYRNAQVALRQAAALIVLRLFTPVQGHVDRHYRTQQRNIALKNVGVYLLRLTAKFTHNRIDRPYDTVCSEWDLLRRAHKELTLAALWHGAFFSNGAHIVDTLSLTYENNPCRLMSELKQQAPDLPLPYLGSWLARVHPVLNYQHALPSSNSDSPQTSKLREQLHQLCDLSIKKDQLKGGFSEKKDGSELSYSSLTQLAFKLVAECEQDKVFPAIVALFQTLKAGIPLERSYLSK